MLKASMTETRSTVSLLFAVLFLFSLTATPSNAEVFRPLQILLPGNLNGNLATLDRDLKVEPSQCWRVVELLDSFRQLKDRDSLVIAPGNDSSIYSPVNYLFRGELERELINRCRPDMLGLSPNDLEMFADTNLSKEIRARVWTNHETIDKQSVFAPYRVQKAGNQRIWFFNYISPEFCSYLPISSWGSIEMDSPKRSLRRLNPDFADNDITVSTAYLPEHELNELTAELKQKPGWHLVIQIPLAGTRPLFSTTTLQQQENLWLLSFEEGHKHLPVINIFRRNNGYPRLTLRRLPFSKSDNHLAEKMFTNANTRIKHKITRPLRVIRPAFQASSSAFRFADQQHARLIKQACNSDVAFLRVPQTHNLVDNVICSGHIVSTVANDRIHSFRLTGLELYELLGALVKNSDTQPAAFAGCDITWFAGELSELKIAGQPYRYDKNYQVSTTEQTLSDPVIRSLNFSEKMRSYEGNTLWKVWINNLKSLRIKDEQLIE